VVFSGGLAGVAYRTITYPLDRIRERVLIKQQESLPAKMAGNFEVGANLVIKEGLKPFYAGIGSQLLRTFGPSALALFAYEISSEWIRSWELDTPKTQSIQKDDL
jgi:hypothetical protein